MKDEKKGGVGRFFCFLPILRVFGGLGWGAKMGKNWTAVQINFDCGVAIGVPQCK
jgi:hypothetical protein